MCEQIADGDGLAVDAAPFRQPAPQWFVERVAPGFSERAELVVEGHGHTEWNDCIARLYERFVRDGSARNVRGATCDAVPRPPFKVK